MSDLMINGKGGRKRRYVATFTCYIYADNDQQAFDDAHGFASRVDDVNDNRFDLEQLHEAPTGSLNLREIDVQQYKLDL